MIIFVTNHDDHDDHAHLCQTTAACFGLAIISAHCFVSLGPEPTRADDDQHHDKDYDNHHRDDYNQDDIYVDHMMIISAHNVSFGPKLT